MQYAPTPHAASSTAGSRALTPPYAPRSTLHAPRLRTDRGGDRLEREGQREGRACPRAVRLGPEIAAVSFGEFARDVEAEAHPALGVGVAHNFFVRAMETLEDRLQLVVRDTKSLIAHAHECRARAAVGIPHRPGGHRPVRADRHGDRATIGRVANRIRQQIDDDLLDAIAIPLTAHRGRLGHHGEQVTRGEVRELIGGLAHQGHEIEGLGAELELPGVEARDVEQRIDQFGHPARLVVDRRQVTQDTLVGDFGAQDALVEELGIPPQRGEGRLQLMRGDREEVVLRLLQPPDLADIAADDHRPDDTAPRPANRGAAHADRHLPPGSVADDHVVAGHDGPLQGGGRRADTMDERRTVGMARPPDRRALGQGTGHLAAVDAAHRVIRLEEIPLVVEHQDTIGDRGDHRIQALDRARQAGVRPAKRRKASPTRAIAP